MKYVNKQKVFIISALVKRGPFHVTKVGIIILMCNTLSGNKFIDFSSRFSLPSPAMFPYAVTPVTAPQEKGRRPKKVASP